MELLTISQVSQGFGVTTRMLRYYEQIGLLQSQKKEGYAYRVYDEAAILRLRQILLLRKLRIPLKQIAQVLEDQKARTAIAVFQQNIAGLEDEIGALSTIRDILQSFVEKLREATTLNMDLMALGDEELLLTIHSLSSATLTKKEDTTMQDLNKASETLDTLNTVRIVHLPPFTIAASHFIGDSPEENAEKQLREFVQTTGLYSIKPDARVFGFNHPNPTEQNPVYGYEMWVTVPDDLEVAPPLTRKHFPGGSYAAHTIVLGNFNEWDTLLKWAENSEKYEPNFQNDNGEYMHGLLEEHLNYVYYAGTGTADKNDNQLDLLLPVKIRE